MRTARMILWLFVLLLTLLPVASHTARPAFAATPYTVTDVCGPHSASWGLNNAGQVVGGVALPTGAIVAAQCDRGVATPLPSLGGTFSLAFGIDDSGHQVVGFSNLPGDTTSHASLWNKGAIQDLGTLGGTTSGADDLNNRGQIVGSSTLPGDTTTHAFLWDTSGIHDLGTLGGLFSAANGINDAGQVVGGSSLPGEQVEHVFLWDSGVMKDLGTLGGPNSINFNKGINNLGQAVGFSDTSIPDPSTSCQPGLPPDAFPETHAFLWASGVMHDLGTLPGDQESSASAINDSGQVVGGSGDFCTGHPVLFQNGTVSDLNALIPAASGWLILNVYDINARGQIAGYGCRVGPECDTGELHAVLLTPGTATGEPGAARSEADIQAQMQRLPAKLKSLLGWHRGHRQGLDATPLG